jgi:4-aminobutyrate aminotransferase-like enzyme
LLELNKVYHKKTLVPPLFASGEHWPLWACFVFDATRTHAELALSHTVDVLAQRHAHLAAVQEHYFHSPPQIERAFKQYMYDVQGRAFLDTVNNVAVLGHARTEVAEAAYSQLLKLNTNSRFLYNALSNFSEEVVSLIPKQLRDQGKLNRVFFVNSGSEATDLALRIARTVVSERRSKRLAKSNLFRDVICVQGGYHGITTASDEVSTTLNDNPK